MPPAITGSSGRYRLRHEPPHRWTRRPNGWPATRPSRRSRRLRSFVRSASSGGKSGRNRNVDLIAEGFDLAIRQGHLPDSGLVARKLEDAALVLVASPEYVARMGTPQTLEDLQRHVCLPFVMPRTGRLAPWVFRDGERDVDWLPNSFIEISDDVLGAVSLAEQGIGICQSYEFIVRDRKARGRLVEILPQLRGRSRPFSVIYAPHRRQSAAARAMIDLLTSGAPGVPERAGRQVSA
ncbi:Transcriptional regulator [Burkholderia dolosa AU0158]|nr:Transcriptional regulator [Burkholderia dolosa AU0158]